MTGIMAARVAETLRQHRTQPGRPLLCYCGFTLLGKDTLEDHRARAIVTRLFGNYNPDAEQPPDLTHRGHPDNIAIHRALKEPLCAACAGWLESRAG